jgi:hypothetical protein
MSATPKIESQISSFRVWQSKGGLKGELAIEAVAELDGVKFVVKKKFEVRWQRTTMKG